MRCALATFALLVGLPISVASCLWDRDTPAEEARGMPDVVAVLTGHVLKDTDYVMKYHSGNLEAPGGERLAGNFGNSPIRVAVSQDLQDILKSCLT